LHTADYTQLYDFLKYNQKEVYELKAERLAKTQDPLALMVNSNNPYAFPAPHQDQSSFNQNYLQQLMPNPEDITDPTTTMNMALTLMAKAFKLNYSTPTKNNQRISSNPRIKQIAQPGMNMGQDRQMQMIGGNGGNQFMQYAGNPAGYNDVVGNQVIQNAVQNPRVQNVGNQNGLNGVQGYGNQNQIGNGNHVAARAEGNATGQNRNQIRCYNCRGIGHYARNCTVRPRRRDAAYLQTQLLIAQKEEAGIQLQAEEYDLIAAAADLDEIEKVNANCILMANLQQALTSSTLTDSAPIYDSDGSVEVHENCDENYDDNEIFNMFTQEEQYNELLEPIPESHQVSQNDNEVISEDTSVEQGGEIVEQHLINFEVTRALYDSLYQNLATEVEKVNSVNHLNKQLSKEKSTVLFLLEEKKRLKSDFKTREDELLDKQIQLEKKIKELNNILLKTGQSIQAIHMLSPKLDSFYHTEQKMALEETLQLAQESREKMKQLNKEIKPANYTKINHLLGVFVPQTALSREELYFPNNSKTANVSISISIPNEDFLDDTTPSVARKFLNEVKSTIVTLQRVVKQRMTIETHNYSSSAHQELHKIVRDEIFRIVNQADARLQNFEIQFLKEAAKFVGDFKFLANEADASLAKHKALELEIERLLKAVDKAYKDMQQKIDRLQAQLGDLKGKSKDTSCVSDTRNPLSQKLENENMELEFQDTSANTKFAKQSIVENLPKVGETNALSKPVTLDSVSSPQESKGVNNDKVIAPGMFRINPFKTSTDEKHVPNTVKASNKKKPITVLQPLVITKKDVNFDVNGLSSTGVDNTKTRRPQSKSNTKHDRVPSASKSSRSKNKEAETRRPQPRSNTKHDRVPSASKSSRSKNKEAEVEEHHRNLLLFKN
nr:hypothetical protein [Tanacetum cinerariifolium]